MKLTLLISLPIVAVLAAPRPEAEAAMKPDFISWTKSPYAPRIHPDPATQRYLSKYGPFVLKGSTAGGGSGSMGGMAMGGGGHDNTDSGQNFFVQLTKGICSQTATGDCTVWGGNISIEYADGRKAGPSTGIYNHHLLTSDTSKKTSNFLSACDNPSRVGMSVSAPFGTGFVGLGEDSGNGPILYTARDGSSDAGYWVAPGDRFLANVDLVNYSKEQQTVYIIYDLEFAPKKPVANTKGMLVSISQCGKMIKLSESGPTNTTSGKFSFLENGSILAARGHLHDGGSQMDMFINGKYACSSLASYGGYGKETEVGGQVWKTISAMSYCDGPIAVKKGDTLAMTVEYDLKRYPQRKSASGHDASGVMGMWSITFAPSA